jgi:5-methylthioadenosine/S-adenosylhomocysteine deaminase
MNTVLIQNGYVIPIEGPVDVIADGAVAVHDDRILAVGPTADVRQALPEPDLIIDARGQAIIPGLVNTHAHLVGSLIKGLTEDPMPGGSGLFQVAVPLQENCVELEDVYPASFAHALEMLRTGTTCINENWWHEGQVARCIEELGLRAVIGPMIRDAPLSAMHPTNPERTWDRKLGEQSLEEALTVIDEWNGAANGRITCRIAPLSPDTCSEKLLVRCLELSQELNLGMHVHMAQVPGEDLYVQKAHGKTPVEYLRDLGYLNANFVGAHCVFMSPSDVDIMAESGAFMSHTAYLVGKRGYFPPMPDIYAAGVSVALGTDWCSNDLFKTMRTAIMVARNQAGSVGVLDGKTVLTMATLGGAKALGLDAQIGSLIPGKKADVAVVDMNTPWCSPVRTENVIANLVYNANGSDVSTVLVDGEILVRNHRLTRFDELELLARTQRAARRVWARADKLLRPSAI